MKTPDLDRIRYVTRHLGDLQAGVTVGLSLGLMNLCQGFWSYSRSALWLLPILASLLGFLFVTTHRHSYLWGYLEARFGRVERKRGWKWTASDRVQGRIFLGVLLLIILLSGCLWYMFSMLHSARDLDLFSDRLLFLISSAYFLFRFIYREYRLAEAYNLGIFALFLAIGARGAFPALTPPAWLFNHSGMPFILYGSALILTGLLDYWQLARTLPPLAEESGALETEETR